MAIWLLGLLVGLLMMVGQPALAATARGAAQFDHLKTGFPLSGSHSTLRCESCHQNGVFKGTPKDCQTCHTSGSRFSRANVVTPNNHIPTTQACDTCHGTQSFAGARFTHTLVVQGTCQTCHDGSCDKTIIYLLKQR